MRQLIALVLASSLAGCAALDWLMPASKGLSVDAEMTIGDKSEEIATGAVVGTKETTNNTADTIAQTYNTINKEAPWWVLVLLVLGWVLPEPSRMGTWIKNTVMGFRRRKT